MYLKNGYYLRNTSKKGSKLGGKSDMGKYDLKKSNIICGWPLTGSFYQDICGMYNFAEY